MNKGTAELPPLYLMYPIGGNALCYADLARSFCSDKPFYAMQAPSPDQLKSETVEELAAFHLRSIRKRDRGGRYELGGWSFGGLLALEMAQQATAAGDPPLTLYLLDPGGSRNLPMEDGPEDELLNLFVLTLIADFNGGKSFDPSEVKTEFDPRGKSLEIQLQKAAELGLLPAGTDVAAHVRSFEIFKRNMHAAKIYRARQYAGKTVLVLPEGRSPERWLPLLPAGAAVVRVPGNHFTMIRGSGAAEIAGLIEAGAGPCSQQSPP